VSEPIVLVALHAGYHHTSLALHSIAAFCRVESFGDSVSVLEWQVKGDQTVLLDELLSRHPTLVGFSTYLWNIQHFVELAEQLKQRHPDCRIVFGGPEAGPRGEELLNSHPEIDFVIDGEGELAFRDLGRNLVEGAGLLDQVSGLIYRSSSGTITRNQQIALPVEKLPTLEQMQTPLDRHLFYWETSRGCPFRCSFCTSCTDQLRQFPMGRIEQDIAFIRRLDNKTIKLLDRSFHLGTKQTVALLRQFIDTPANIRFHLELNPDRISAQALEIFRQAPAGKFQFEIGLQTLTEPVLSAIDRNMDVGKSLTTLEQLIAIKQHPVHLDLIAGLPGETVRSFRSTIDRTFRLLPNHLQLGILKLLPGTPLRQQAEHRFYRYTKSTPYTVISSDTMSEHDIATFTQFAELLERLWNSGWATTTLQRLISAHFSGSACALFDHLLEGPAAEILLGRSAPPDLFDALCTALLEQLAEDEVLRECLLWDYAHLERPSRTTPTWIQENWRISQGVALLNLSGITGSLINTTRANAVSEGQYQVRLQVHVKGRPVTLKRVA
jgi:anaerobic magnesium-protoporphyrin IX monomethyl ester cyclase